MHYIVTEYCRSHDVSYQFHPPLESLVLYSAVNCLSTGCSSLPYPFIVISTFCVCPCFCMYCLLHTCLPCDILYLYMYNHVNSMFCLSIHTASPSNIANMEAISWVHYSIAHEYRLNALAMSHVYISFGLCSSDSI